jgi:hypothetical protein
MKMKIGDVVVDLIVYFVGSSGELSSVIGQAQASHLSFVS